MITTPPGTVIFELDGIHQVTLQFKTEDDAIIFYESLIALDGGSSGEWTPDPDPTPSFDPAPDTSSNDSFGGGGGDAF